MCEVHVNERMCEIGQEILGALRQTGGWVKAAGVVAAGGHRLGWRPFCGGWRG